MNWHISKGDKQFWSKKIKSRFTNNIKKNIVTALCFCLKRTGFYLLQSISNFFCVGWELQYFKLFRISCMLTRPSLRCWLMVLCEGPSSDDNLRVLLLGCCSAISIKASSCSRKYLSVFFESGVIFLKMFKPGLCHRFIESSWAITSFFSCTTAFAHSPFLQVA